MNAEYVDVARILAGPSDGPKTTVGGRRGDGIPLLYASAVNILLGAPEAGKTLVAGGMAADELFSSGRVLWIDLDHNGAHALLTRLLQFGVKAETLTDPALFRLAIPEDAEAVAAIVHDPQWSPTLVILDSIGELLPMFGANSNDADDYTRVHRAVLTALANRGAGVLGIDHEAKNQASQAYGATGSAAKKRAVDGALLRVTNVRPFAPGAGGEAQLSIVKDRHGSLRALGNGREPIVAAFVLTAVGGGSTYRFAKPTTPAPAIDDVQLLASLSPRPSSVRDIKERMGWGTTRASEALKALRDVPGTFPDVPGTGGGASVPPFPPPIGGTGNTPRNTP
ncbi:MAG: AAA family ATPase [Microbacterium sp.]